jgi:lipopolysaccharide export system permease protein
LNIIWIIIISIIWILSIIWVAYDSKKRGSSWIIWIFLTLFFWLVPYGLFLLTRVISNILLRLSFPIGFQLVDRYLYMEIIKMTVVTVLGIAFIILANNIYNSADMFAQKKTAGKVPLEAIAAINLLDTPASVVLAFPVATLIGVMLALGILGQGGETTAIRTGGISLQRLILPVLILSVGFSVVNYYLSQDVVPWCAEKSANLKTKYLLGEKEANVERHVLFKHEDRIIYAARYDMKSRDLTKVTAFWQDDKGLYHIWLSYKGVFKGNELKLYDVKKYVCDADAQLQRYEPSAQEALPFPAELQAIHEKKRDAFTLAAGDLATKIQRFEESGIDPTAAKIDQQFQISVPLACTIFAFVGFIFSLYNPRKEVSVGVLYAILIAFVYYVFMAVIRSLAKQEQDILRNPYLAAWLTNFVFFIFGLILFKQVRK